MYSLFQHLLNMYNILQQPSSDQRILTAFALGTLPVLYFFSFLYYTDPGSTFCILLVYFLAQCHFHKLGACASILAVLYRQTNIVWVAFIASTIAVQYIEVLVRRKCIDRTAEAVSEYDWSFALLTLRTLTLKCKLNELLQLVHSIVSNTVPYVLVGIGFVVFVVVNGGIVVGAKTDHQAGLHFAQMYYFAAFCGVFAFAQLVSIENIVKFRRFVGTHILGVIVFCCLSIVLILNFTYVHRYTLADNRHYTFYIWSKILNRHPLARFSLIPGYLFAFWCIDHSLAHKTVLWRLMFVLFLGINLIPSTLLELRYFIVPYLLWRVNMKQTSSVRLTLEIIFNVVINAVTIYIFLEKPFFWPDDNAKQRFMW